MNAIYQILPPLLPDEFDALKASIAERGVDVPIIVDQDGNVIDGYHRQRACDELGIFCPREIRQFESETDKLELVLRLNCGRRQLNRQQKRLVIDAFLLRDPQIADNFLAQIIGVSKNTVADVRSTLEATCQIDKFDQLRGKDGKLRPVRYTKIIANTPEEAETALKIIGKLPDNCTGKTIDIATAKRESRKAKATAIASRNQDAVHVAQKIGNIEVLCGDSLTLMRERMTPQSVDVAVTSPPYNTGMKYGTYDDKLPEAEYLDWLDKVFAAIKGVLADEGSLFLNIGSKPTDPKRARLVTEIAERHFVVQNQIIWVKSISTRNETGGHFTPLNSERYLNHNWEHVLHLTKTGYVPIDRLAVGVPYMDKNNIRRSQLKYKRRCRGDVWFIPHETVQSQTDKWNHPCPFPVTLAEWCIRLHGRTDDMLVLDPFNGVGSSTVAMTRVGIHGVGIDIDPAYCKAAVNRLEDELAHELIICIEDIYSVRERPIPASDLAGWEKNENVPPGTATRLLGRLPEEIRRLVDNGESSAA